MYEWFIVISFWAANGELVKTTSAGTLPNQQVCERYLKAHVADWQQTRGNASGICVRSPEKPKNMPIPQEVQKGLDL